MDATCLVVHSGIAAEVMRKKVDNAKAAEEKDREHTQFKSKKQPRRLTKAS